ncbi:uncharacterized protein LOC108092280 [Drosophila ficusphila]|uniref:uncharacterized protein LOC108092280 n=1 Tax=Drosophila ficusphila TaxID=30025 RepID=UPI001C89BB30|nr:uncharacterized protein LOC108092280 [Drosophila ficusphila]
MKQPVHVVGWMIFVLLLGVSAEHESILSANRRIMDQTQRIIDENGDRCELFYDYANGKDGGKPLYVILQERMDPKLFALFEHLKFRNFEEESLEEKALQVYTACEKAMEEEPELNYWDLVQPDVDLPWPQNTPPGSLWPKEKFQWLATLGRLRRYGMDLFFRMELELDHQLGSSKYMLSFGSPKFVINSYYSVWGGEDWLIRRGFNRTKAELLFRDMNRLRIGVQNMLGSEAYRRQRMTLQQLESEHGFPVGRYLEIVFGRPFPPDFEVLVDYLEYLTNLHKLMSSYDQETVATYLMEVFVNYMRAEAFPIITHREYDFPCVRFVSNSMTSVSYFLYNTHFLGYKKIVEYDEEIQRIFEAVREQFSKRLNTNRLNLTNSEVNTLRELLSSITVNVGNVPRFPRYSRYLTDFYVNLQLKNDDDFPTIHMKVSEVQEQLKLQKFVKIELNEPFPMFYDNAVLVGNGTSIVVPLPLLEEPLFSTRGHDVFKVCFSGNQKSLFPYPKLPSSGCKKFNELVETFDDLGKYVDISNISPRECEMSNWRDIILVLLNMVQDAYFSPGSGFDQTQPTFTDKSLKQLFYLHFAQNRLDKNFYYNYNIRKTPFNTLRYLPSFREAFNCSSLN